MGRFLSGEPYLQNRASLRSTHILAELCGDSSSIYVKSKLHSIRNEVLSVSQFCLIIYCIKMPLEDDDQERVDKAMEEMGADSSGTRLLVLNASKMQKLGFWTLLCAVVNRSVGTML